MNADFTLTKYQKLLEAGFKARYTFVPVLDYLKGSAPSTNTIILRHDVDRRPEMALQMARLEHQIGIRSTFYFRTVRHVFAPEIIAAIHRLDHEIGYHYETLADSRGDPELGFELFQEQLAALREVASVATISMHGRPLSRWDSRELWGHYDFRELGLAGEAYLSIDYEKVTYFNDTGRTWHPTRYNLRDIAASSPTEEPHSTDDLMDVIATRKHREICISAHPDRWAHSPFRWATSMTTDSTANLIKLILKHTRKRARPVNRGRADGTQ